jgi:hypothetical protein
MCKKFFEDLNVAVGLLDSTVCPSVHKTDLYEKMTVFPEDK